MTRALIADPDMPNKAKSGALDDIRACIACNQACIGHFHKGYPISCIQYPETGRELTLGARKAKAKNAKHILVIGGGPAGMKASAVLAERGHRVTLCEAASQLGGQALLAQLLPGRAEFGGIATNLQREAECAGVEIRRKTDVSRALMEALTPDHIVIATGAKPRRPALEGEGAHIVHAWQVLKGEVNIGARVVIADWRADWIGLGLAEKLARDGVSVTLAVEGPTAGEALPFYVRDEMVARLHRLGVVIRPYHRLFGADGDTVYFHHASSGDPILIENIETLVLAQGHDSVNALEEDAKALGIAFSIIGDALTPRTAEDAVLDGLKLATSDLFS
jgi:NADPH-dependent 2,4-dienoyl-CoA reductase/sulfur reductase-like enzyme